MAARSRWPGVPFPALACVTAHAKSWLSKKPSWLRGVRMDNILTSYDRTVHSDFLVHWTGKDIDSEHQPDWYGGDHRSTTPPAVEDLYLCRLRDILTHGLWMTEEGDRQFRVGSTKITIPATPQCCFTELKLSESRRHAARYGRLGIGVKRPFLFNRFGRPLTYFGFGEQSHNDKFLEACADHLWDKSLLNFFKPMISKPRPLNYDLYAESEWRVLYFDELLKSGKIIDPRDSANAKAHAYFKNLQPVQQNKIKYLVPLDGWFAMVVYPSLKVKDRAQWGDPDHRIAEEIRRIKSNRYDDGNQVEGLKNPTRGNWPIEVNLDACREF
jgi:hypothetical protein